VAASWAAIGNLESTPAPVMHNDIVRGRQDAHVRTNSRPLREPPSGASMDRELLRNPAPKESLMRRPALVLEAHSMSPDSRHGATDAGHMQGRGVDAQASAARDSTVQRRASRWYCADDVAVLLSGTRPSSNRQWRTRSQESSSVDRSSGGSCAAEDVAATAAAVAHDLRNIFGAIISSAECILMDAQDSTTAPQLVAEDARNILEACAYGRAVIEKVALLSRDLACKHRPARVQDAVRAVCGMYRRATPAGVRVEVELDESVPPVGLDDADTRRIVANLLSNAIESLDGQRGLVRISVTAVDGARAAQAGRQGVVLTVCDNGKGMDAATSASAFKLHFTTKSPPEGHGLGLAAVAHIVERQGGSIAVWSAEGQGTTVEVTLPIAEVTIGSVRPPPDEEGLG